MQTSATLTANEIKQTIGSVRVMASVYEGYAADAEMDAAEGYCPVTKTADAKRWREMAASQRALADRLEVAL
jgi:hypothetical protein